MPLVRPREAIRAVRVTFAYEAPSHRVSARDSMPEQLQAFNLDAERVHADSEAGHRDDDLCALARGLSAADRADPDTRELAEFNPRLAVSCD